MYHTQNTPSLPPLDHEQHGLPTLAPVDPSHDPNFLATISPCSTIPDAHGTSQPSLLHLLACGHTVAIDEPDRRCGLNCHHATERAPTAYASSKPLLPENMYISSTLLHRCSTDTNTLPRHNDKLYCEVCTGIPIDRYQVMNPPSNEFFPTFNPVLRRCLALSRELIAAATRLPARRVDSLLAPVFPVLQWRLHDLLCGHKVWCEAAKRCGVNCVEDVYRADAVCTWEGKCKDVIVCGECVDRVEIVYRRYARVEVSAGLWVE